MITQIQRWRRFLVESAGGCPELEFETDKGWSIAFFFSHVQWRTLNLIEPFSHIRNGGRSVQNIIHGLDERDCDGAFVLTCLPLDLGTGSGSLSLTGHK
jgi:hypothetical protein